jgi:hypothetical protein
MWIDVFRTGTQTDSAGNEREWTASELDRIVLLYNEQPEATRHDAPVTIGHPTDNSPAYGWVESLRRVGDTLQAKFRDMEAKFVELVNSKRYPKRSIALYDDGMLRHIGFLGAVPPAVKGLPDVKLSFAAGQRFSEFDNEFDTIEGESPSATTQQPQAHPRQTRAAVWGIAPKNYGHDDIPQQYADLTPDHFADPVNLRFPMSKRFMPGVLASWSREAIRKEYSETEQQIVAARLIKAARGFGYGLTAAKWAYSSPMFVEVPAQNLTKKQLVDIVRGNLETPTSTTVTPNQQAITTTPSQNYAEVFMPEELLKQMLEELLTWTSETYGEETANQIAGKITELQDKYAQQAAGTADPAAAGTAPAAAPATAMSERETQMQKEFSELQRRVVQMETNERLLVNNQFCDGLINTGALLPAQKDRAMELLLAAHDVPGELTFSETVNNTRKKVKKPFRAAFQEFLSGLKQISLDAQATSDRAQNGNRLGTGNEFADANPDRLQLHYRVLELQGEAAKQNKSLTYREALSVAASEKENN